jgi:hypothetical protein
MSGSPEEFVAALHALYEDAASPPYACLVRQAARQQRPVKLTEQSLSDWLSGKSVPADPTAVLFLAQYLSNLAKRADHLAHVRPPEWWLQLHDQARRDRHARRGGRPSASSTDRPVPAELSGRGQQRNETQPPAAAQQPSIQNITATAQGAVAQGAMFGNIINHPTPGHQVPRGFPPDVGHGVMRLWVA